MGKSKCTMHKAQCTSGGGLRAPARVRFQQGISRDFCILHFALCIRAATPPVMSHLDSSILKAFLLAGDEPVSGDRLAKELGVSRVSIWQRLEGLRAAGFVFDAAPRKGYRFTAPPAGVHPALLDAHLRLRKVRAKVDFHEEIDSTNSEAERRLAAGDEAPFVTLAGRQTAGRGRLGRVWHSAHPENLYMSFAFRPFLPPEAMRTFTLTMGLKLCENLASRHALDALRLKWPNDLVCDGRKIAGMLTESRMDSDQVRDLVFGLGLNVNGDPATMAPEVRATAGSLAHALGRKLDLHAEAAEVIVCVLDAYETFEAAPHKADPRALFDRFDSLRGREVTVGLRGEPLTGVAEGVDAHGALLLRLTNGALFPVNAGEVTIAKNPKGKIKNQK